MEVNDSNNVGTNISFTHNQDIETIIKNLKDEIEEIKFSIDRKEDDLKNLINEKDIKIKKLDSKIVEQEVLIKNNENKIKDLNSEIKELKIALKDQSNERNNTTNKINEINYMIKNDINNIIYKKGDNEVRDITNKISDISSNIDNNNYCFNEILIEVNENLKELTKTQKIFKYSYLNLMLNEIPKNILVNEIRYFYNFFTNSYHNIKSLTEKLQKEIMILLKKLYCELINNSLTGELNSLLIENINTSNKDIIKFINCPNEFLLKKIIENNNLNQNDNNNEEISNNYKKEIDKIFPLNYNMPTLITEKKIYNINYNNFESNSSFLTFPFIIKINGILKSNYNKIFIQKGPYCPQFYSGPIILDIISLVDEDIIAEICEYNREKTEEINIINSNEKVQNLIYIFPFIKEYIKVKKNIAPKETIQIEIKIPELKENEKISNCKYLGVLKLISGQSNYEIILDINILIVPNELLLSCRNYKLELKNGNYYIYTNDLISRENLIFKIKSHFKGEYYFIETKIILLEGNESEKPTIEKDHDEIKIIVPDSSSKRLCCKIEFYLSLNYKIPIIIDSIILPDYNIQFYDYLKKKFVSLIRNDYYDLILPIYDKNLFKENNFTEYLPYKFIDINLYILINIHYIKENLHAIIETENIYNFINFEFKEKEIKLEKIKTEFTCKIRIEVEKMKNIERRREIGKIKFNIQGNIHYIRIEIKNFYDFYRQILFQLDYNNSNNDILLTKTNTINRDKINICLFGAFNYNITKYFCDKDEYYKLTEIPNNNYICFISDSGDSFQRKCNKREDFQFNKDRKENILFWKEKNNYPLFGICGNNWYPIISYYENTNILFGTFDKISNIVGRKKRELKPFSFSFFVQIIIDNIKNETILDSLYSNLPDSIKSIINKELLIEFKNSNSKEKKIEISLNILEKIYYSFIKKIKEIKRNGNIINFSDIPLDKIKNQIEKLYNNFYCYDPLKEEQNINNDNSNNNLINKFEKIIKKISESKNDEKPGIISDIFLITKKENKEVDINTQQIELINISEKNKQYELNNIEIEDIIQPNTFTIKSMIEYFENCIIATKLFPNFIRYILLNNNSEKKNKATNILNKLINLYNSFDRKNQSLISPIIEEYNKSFEIMYLKLKQSNIIVESYYPKNLYIYYVQYFINEPKKKYFKIEDNKYNIIFNKIKG